MAAIHWARNSHRFGVLHLKCGSLGFYDDFLHLQSSQHGINTLVELPSPGHGLTEKLLNLSQGILIQAPQSEDTHAGAEA